MVRGLLRGLRSFRSPAILLISTMSTAAPNRKAGGIAAIVQLTCTSDKSSNFDRARTLIEQAVKDHKAAVVFLPEAFDFIGESTAQTLKLAEPIDGPLLSQYKNLARNLDVSLSLGGFHETTTEEGKESSPKIRNTHIFIDGKSGDITAKYSKTHLFDVEIPERGVRLKESDYVNHGKSISQPVLTDIGSIGLGICYDLRFPEMSIGLARRSPNGYNAVDILTYPSAFTVHTGSAHWEVLLRARAIENQCYVIAAAQTGTHNAKRSSYGHSMIVNPWGSVIAHCSEGESVSSAYIDLEYLEKVRKDMPVWSHRRHDLYGLVLENEMYVQGFKSPSSDTDISESNQDQSFGSFTIPAREIVMTSRHSYVTVNIKPVVPYHLLVIPKRQGVNKLSNLSCDETADLFNLVRKAQKLVEHFRGVTSSTICIQDGEDAGQTVRQIHVHVLPRAKNDFENNDDIYTELDKHDHEPGRQNRSPEEMEREAKLLRIFLIEKRNEF